MLLTSLFGACGGGGSETAGVEQNPTAVTRAASSKEASTPIDWVVCATESQLCAFTGTSAVRYGSTTGFVTGSYTDGVTCSNAIFGDPAPGYTKVCSVPSTTVLVPSIPPAPAPTNPITPETPVTPTPAVPTTNWITCASEGQTCTFSGTRSIRYGTPSQNVSGSYTAQVACTNAIFGDPAPGSTKSCAYAADADPTTPTWIYCAGESQFCAFTGTAAVRYGTDATFVSFNFSGGVACSNVVFGDPAPGSTKTCRYQLQTSQSPGLAIPAITVQPQPSAVSSGQPASFGVTATSSTPLTYQWSRNGRAIAGATSALYKILATQLADSGAMFSVAVTNGSGTTRSSNAGLTVNAIVSPGPTAQRLFSDQSLWNARPTQFTLGTATIPTSDYYPAIGSGAYSVAAAIASNTDPAVTVMGPSEKTQLFVADAENYVPSIVIPHWPANVTPASGSDGHADIIDVAANKIHSFYQLAKDSDGQWRALQYTWTPLDGTGWGTTATYMQGSRAAGVVPIAGLIRINEVNDGLPSYRHALAMSLTFNGLSPSPAYVFPATSADSYAEYTNTGQIPEGARLMLPADFDSSAITNAQLLKVVETLKIYGAYAVDRNYGTPYSIYVENGANFNLMPAGGWDGVIAGQLQTIRAALRPIDQVTQWVDATGAVFTPPTNLNLLSMRGLWVVDTGKVPGTFDTWQQAVVFPANGVYTSQINAAGRSVPAFAAATPVAGTRYSVRVTASGGATMRLTLTKAGAAFDSGVMRNGDQVVLTWPSGATGAVASVRVSSGPTGGGTVSGTMVQLAN